MDPRTSPVPPRGRPRGPRARPARPWTPLLALLLLLLQAGAARAEGCAECKAPTEQELAQDPAFALETRGSGLFRYKDRWFVDGGECDVTITDTPEVERRAQWLVLRGSGEVWNCPHSRSADTMTASINEGDLTAWTLSGDVGASVSFLGASLSAKLSADVRQQVSVNVVTTISKQINAGDCRRIRWYAYFLVADLEATVDYTLKRRFAWWTKNKLTGDTVLRKGDYHKDCGGGRATFRMHAPLEGTFRLLETGCGDPECAPIEPHDLGFFPPLEQLWPPPEPEPWPEGDPDGGAKDGSTSSSTEEPVQAGDPEPEVAEPLGPEEEPAQPVPSSDELDDPPAGVSPPPPGFEDTTPETSEQAS
jgi:hypothetical protein